MNGTSVRDLEDGAGFSALPDLSGMGRAERIETLRSRMSTMGAAVPKFKEEPAEAVHPQLHKNDILPVPDSISALLPRGGLPRRAVAIFQEQPLLVAELLTHVTAQGGYAAVIGWKDFAYAGVTDSGGVCENLIVIPDPGIEPLNVAAVLCEGLDLVVYRGPKIMLSASRARPLLGKLRKGTAALMMVGTEVASPALMVESEIINYLGIGPGRGRIRGVEMNIRATGKGQAPVNGRLVISRPQDAELLRDAPVTKPQLWMV